MKSVDRQLTTKIIQFNSRKNIQNLRAYVPKYNKNGIRICELLDNRQLFRKYIYRLVGHQFRYNKHNNANWIDQLKIKIKQTIGMATVLKLVPPITDILY